MMDKRTSKKAALIILDGWGIGKDDPHINAIAAAKTPCMNRLMSQYPNTTLYTFGKHVGLPEGQMGNSEVGHLNIGAGRVVYQQLVIINKAFESGEVAKNQVLTDAFEYAGNNNKKIHLLGLVSNGGVHSSLEHLKGLCTIASEAGLQDKLFIHAFTDGRDTDPKSGIEFITEIENHLHNTGGKIASVIGRYYAMDRDKRWERTKLAYDLLVNGTGKPATSTIKAIEDSYNEGVTDEFITPVVITDNENKPLATIAPDDVVIFFNFRTDRGRQLTMALTQQDFPEFGMKAMPLYYITMTNYDATYKNVQILFGEQDLQMTLGEVIEKTEKTQLRVAETEKYPHVTFFFSGGRETPFIGEKRILVASPKVATYDLKPSMSAEEITGNTILEIEHSHPDLLVLNFANPDMVGHTGVFSAVVEAIETVDKCLERLVEVLQKEGYDILVTADHGNADFVVNDDGTPNTAHTTNLVPLILVTENKNIKLTQGKLADLAPTILYIMGIPKPEQMTGNILVKEN